MPKGIPNKKPDLENQDAPEKEPKKSITVDEAMDKVREVISPDPEIEKLKKELADAKAKLAKLSEPEEELGPPPTQEPVVPKVVDRRIQDLTMPGKAIDVTEHGYDFQSIHIRSDIPVEVLAQAFVARVGDSQKGEDIKEAFFHPQSMINLYANSGKKRRIRTVNGVVEYGTEKFVIPFINPEVILRVLEDRWRNDRKVRSFFAGVKEVEYAKSLANIKKVYALL